MSSRESEDGFEPRGAFPSRVRVLVLVLVLGANQAPMRRMRWRGRSLIRPSSLARAQTRCLSPVARTEGGFPLTDQLPPPGLARSSDEMRDLTATNRNMVSLFAGAGGLDAGLELAGFRTVLAV